MFLWKSIKLSWLEPAIFIPVAINGQLNLKSNYTTWNEVALIVFPCALQDRVHINSRELEALILCQLSMLFYMLVLFVK